MAILQYKCPACGKEFEELVKSHEDAVPCPACGTKADRSWSGCMYSATGKQAKKCSGNCKSCGGCR